MVKDPATGKRISRPNPPDQYRTAEVPTLRIVADDVWQIVQRRKRGNAERGPSKTANPKTKRMLAGLLRCGACGGAMVSSGDRHGTARIQCSAFRESGTCQNGRRVKRDDVERMTLAGLRAELAQPVYLAEYVAVYNEERKRLARDAGNQRGKLERRKAAIERYMDAYRETVAYMYSDPMALKYYAEIATVPESLAKRVRDEFFTKEMLMPDRVIGMDLIMPAAVTLKYLAAPIADDKLKALFQIPPPRP